MHGFFYLIIFNSLISMLSIIHFISQVIYRENDGL